MPISPGSLARLLRLIVVTDRRLADPGDVTEIVAEALQAGALAVQLREKAQPPREVLPLARRLRADTRRHGALFFVNDRLDLALAAEADGVHLGPDDLPVRATRELAPPGFLIGYSADEVDKARLAVRDGADYIGCGTVYPTATKRDAGRVTGIEGLRTVARAINAPVVGIGGVTPARAPAVVAAGAAGCAAIGAVMAAANPRRAVADFLRAAKHGARQP
ncbi:MAG: thiamine phosphate synthase [Gemmatimonadetes bacterium]|nr:thiamine phosphate synthase [Gemmatimonadota bacterium]MCY3612191.1 thiamine phosphate synthase [Gemmatimonadota bacterium]MCY3676272.1 thiamine phosphate synthase [Gemmatimonadota bacterium]MYA41861.1 thiamine phosphate synthase [Gemmatimonadota bacterium]MYE94535.1 thiamine phosphate synthase [Gemmatimonadota bacterium]